MTAWREPNTTYSTVSPADYSHLESVVHAGEDTPQEPGLNPAPEKNEMDRLEPIGTRITLSSGTIVDLQPLKLRQFLKFLRILTSGASEIWANMRLSMDDEQAFTRDLMGLAVFALPQAENETVDFLKSMVAPADLSKQSGRAGQDARMEAWSKLSIELENPELEDTLSLIQGIIETEASDLMALGKRLRKMFALVQTNLPRSGEPTPS